MIILLLRTYIIRIRSSYPKIPHRSNNTTVLCTGSEISAVSKRKKTQSYPNSRLEARVLFMLYYSGSICLIHFPISIHVRVSREEYECTSMKSPTLLSFRHNSTSKVWMALTIFGIAILAVLLPQLYDMRLDIANAGDGSQGDPWTVCASGCDFTTLTATFASTTVGNGDYINIDASYATSTETQPIDFNSKTNLTLDCQNSGATLGDTAGGASILSLPADSTLQNCTISNMLVSLNASTLTLSGNTFSTSTTSSVQFGSGTNGATVSNNTGLQRVYTGSTGASNITVSNNTIEAYDPNGDTNVLYFFTAENISVTSNTIRSYDSSIKNLVYVDLTTSTLIQDNVLEYETASSEQFPNGAIYLEDAVSTTVSYNDIILESSLGIADQANDGIRFYNDTTGRDVDATIEHNSIWMYQDGHTGINFFDAAGGTAGNITITANYNIFYNASSTASLGNGFQTSKNNSGSTYTLTNDYNGYYSIGTQIQDNTSDGFSPSVGSNSITDNPYFKINDASSSNDTELAPFSLYLDANGSTDIGAYSAARGSSFTIDDDCTVDYASCHGTSTSIIAATAATNDTWTLAAGTYSNFAMTTTSRRTGSVTIDGAGASTLISNASASPIKFTGLDSMTIQDLIVQDATSSASSYTWTGLSFDYGGTSYNQTLALEFPSDGYAILVETDCNVGNLVTFMPPTDGNDVTSYLGMGTDNYHIALTTVFGSPVTMIVPSSVAANQAAYEALTDCITPAAWVDTAFAQSGGSYTYDSAAFASASITVTSGYTAPPALAQVSSLIAGIQLIDTTNTTITNVTSTNNLYGISLEGTAATTVISDSTIANSTQYDIYSDSTNNNTLKNVDFTRASSTISGTGNVDVQFKTRALIQNTSSTPLGGVGLTFTSDDTSQTYSATTTDTGYTAYSGYLSAFTMTSSSIATNNGGYNPYAVSVSATSTYAASSTAFTLDSVDETITVTMIGAPDVPAFSSFTNTTSSIQAAWGAVSEAAYYTVSSTVPGFTSVTTTNTNISYTGLDPATTYNFQIKSTNGIDLSSAFSSVTSTITDTPPALDPPTVTDFSNTTTSIQISWSSVSGATYYTVSSTVAGFETVTTTNTNYTYTSLDPATTYYFQTQTRDAYGQDGSFSSVTSTITDTPPPPSAPTISEFTNTTTTIQVSWGAVSGAAYYTVSSTADSAVTTTNTNYTFNSLDPATSYTFQVKTTDAYDQDSSYSSASSTVTETPDPLAAPTVTGFTNTTTSIQIAWSAVSGATYYTVSSTATGFETVTTTNTNYTYTSLDPATTYYFQTQTRDAYSQDGSFSSVTSTITDTPDPLAAPIITGFTNTTSSIQISWDAVAGATYYTVSSTVTGFETVTTTNTNYSYSDLDPATTYYFQTQTRDAYAQDGSFSSVTSTITDTPPALDPPTVSGFSNTTTSIQISWSAVSGATYYTVSSTVTGFETVTTTNTNYTYIDLDPATTYYFQTQTRDEYSQDGDFSSVTSTITDTPPALDPPTVTGFTNTTSTIQVTWDAVAGATYYTVSSTVTGYETVTTTNTNYKCTNKLCLFYYYQYVNCDDVD
ncbi:MAG: hypothetical protein UW10_C0024G0002 [Candidatus Magasanikbacteria bacterium GW2011_GWA2_43_9]|nr:MAG: hypothetical protein UW10_C0024G0002 [Candidatus Magasanikbacteria bacterium GW2011_GWA2_43_9]